MIDFTKTWEKGNIDSNGYATLPPINLGGSSNLGNLTGIAELNIANTGSPTGINMLDGPKVKPITSGFINPNTIKSTVGNAVGSYVSNKIGGATLGAITGMLGLTGKEGLFAAGVINNIGQTALSGAVKSIGEQVGRNVAQTGLKTAFNGSTKAALNGVKNSLKGMTSGFEGKANMAGMVAGLANQAFYGNSRGTKVEKTFDKIADAASMAGSISGLAGVATPGLNIGLAAYLTLKLANNMAGKTNSRFVSNNDVLSQMGGSYSGAMTSINKALSDLNLHYTWTNRSRLKKDLQNIYNAGRMQNNLEYMMDNVNLNQESANNTTGYLSDGYYNNLYDALDLNTMLRAAKLGGRMLPKQSLSRARMISAKQGRKLELPKKEFKFETSFTPIITSSEISDKSIPSFLTQTKYGFTTTIKNNKEDAQRYKEFKTWKNSKEGKAFRKEHNLSFHMDEDSEGNITLLNKDKIEDFYNATGRKWHGFNYNDPDYLSTLIPVKNKYPTEDGKYYVIDEDGEEQIYDNPIENITSFKEGGQMNVIPEGNLHARLHHMEDNNPDLEGQITKKGIPVITENAIGDIELQAEIELNEIIFNKEVTTKLEELAKKYKSEDSNKEDKEQAAFDAGELLAIEIMENTDDRTGLINEIS